MGRRPPLPYPSLKSTPHTHAESTTGEPPLRRPAARAFRRFYLGGGVFGRQDCQGRLKKKRDNASAFLIEGCLAVVSSPVCACALGLAFLKTTPKNTHLPSLKHPHACIHTHIHIHIGDGAADPGGRARGAAGGRHRRARLHPGPCRSHTHSVAHTHALTYTHTHTLARSLFHTHTTYPDRAWTPSSSAPCFHEMGRWSAGSCRALGTRTFTRLIRGGGQC